MHLNTLKPTQQELLPRLVKLPDFYLAGGTALALQIGHRISDDFDLFSDKALSTGLLKKVETVFSVPNIAVDVNTTDELSVRINGVSVSFVYYPFPPLLPLVQLGPLSALSVSEIAATKAYAIGRRRELKDYIDLFTIFSQRLANPKDTISLAKQKFGDAFNARLYLEQLLDFKNIPQDKPVNFLGSAPTQTEMQQLFEEMVKKVSL